MAVRRRPGIAKALVAACTVAASISSAGAQSPRQAPSSGDVSPEAARAVLSQYCLGCHNERAKVAGLALDTLDIANPAARADVWERVIEKVRAETMPPAGSRRPDAAGYRAVRSWLEESLDRAAAAHPNPGRTQVFHRLNRVEYRNAIRDLLAIDLDVTSLLPADNTYEHGFDNNADSLSLSPDLLARYFSAAKKISRLALGIAPLGPTAEIYKIHPNDLQGDRASDDLPFGSRGGLAIHHSFPVDGEYGIKIKLHRNFSDYILGFGSKYQIEARLDGKLLKRFTVGGEAKGNMAPLSFAGNIYGEPDWEYYMINGDAGLELKFRAQAGPRILGVAFLGKLVEEEGIQHPRNRGYGRFVDEQYDANALVERVEIGGPYAVDGPGDTPSRRAILTCKPTSTTEASCARKILSRLAKRAYRRPVTVAEIESLMKFFREGRQDSGFDGGIQFALEGMLVDPDFLYRVERDPGNVPSGTAYRISDLELASRLSFFLWSSIPDEPLLDAAIAGTLRNPRVLEQHVRRMLADSRSDALLKNFVAQWLRLRNLQDQQRESAEYPEFDENLREAFRRETELFVRSTFLENRSVIDLLSANYTFVNERLARHYGIANVYGSRFRRVTFRPGDPRGGLLGHGSILTVTSHPNRTSPVLRGKWLLETILGAPPPEPPADVPGLPDRGEGGKPASVRERLELHRKNPVCAACHAPMDPLGFALENFDAIGSWRALSEAGTPIDATGTMPNGKKFEGPSGLRQLLLSKREDFASNVTSKLLAYAIGRRVEFYDAPAVRQIVRDAAASEYRWSAIILGIVKSTSFQMRATSCRVEGRCQS